MCLEAPAVDGTGLDGWNILGRTETKARWSGDGDEKMPGSFLPKCQGSFTSLLTKAAPWLLPGFWGPEETQGTYSLRTGGQGSRRINVAGEESILGPGRDLGSGIVGTAGCL